jgi:hypothetical protein
MHIDLTQPINLILLAVASGVAAVVSAVLMKIAKKIGISNDTAMMANIDAVAQKGISFAVMAAQEQIKAKGWDHPEVQNQLIAGAAQYVADNFQGTLAKAGIDPTTPEGTATIKNIVTRALPAGTAAAEASPTTPAAPGPDNQKGS